MGGYTQPPGRGGRDRRDTLYFLSDYGVVDEFVGVVKAVVRAIAPGVDVVDLTHGVPPQDVVAGALALSRAMPYVRGEVVLAVVDPGVGTERHCVAVEADDGGVLVGPDNGLLSPALALVGGARRAVSLTAREYHLHSPGPTFAGRDVMGPAAAHLCAGADVEVLGDPLDPARLAPLEVPGAVAEAGGVRCRVTWVDRYGNVQLSALPTDLATSGGRLVVRVAGRDTTARRVTAYAELNGDELGVLVDSSGHLALVVNRASAAQRLGLAAGEEVVVAPGSS